MNRLPGIVVMKILKVNGSISTNFFDNGHIKVLKRRSLKESMIKIIMQPFTMLFKLIINLSLETCCTDTIVVGINFYQCFSMIGCVFFFNFQDVNLLGYDGQTPLHLAASSSEIETEIKRRNDTEGVIFQI